ncbi:MAG: hypothetical protein ACXABG_04110 [Promethearchaeota archaeon]|jgi:hypothetical protein
MVYLATIFKYPPTSAEDAGKVFFKAMKDFPNLYKEGKPAKRVIGLVRAEDGFEVTTIWEVTGKFLEASQEISKLFLSLTNDVKGSYYTLKTYMSVMESLPILGMTPPTL